MTQGLELTRDEVNSAQQEGRFCKSLRLGAPHSRSEYFMDEDESIYRRGKNGEHQMVVPGSLMENLISLNHDPETVGHQGRNSTLEILCLRFYWPGMR